MNTWIFQANPKYFNVDKYLVDRKNIWWSIRQKHFLEIIEIGDEVYLWRSDGNQKGTGGIVAKARVVGQLQERDDSDAKEYWHTEDWKSTGTGIPLEVVELRISKGFIRRTELLEHQLLKDLDILKMSNLTNYLLTEEQKSELGRMWAHFTDTNSEIVSSFTPVQGARKLYKQVGISQYTDGVRIDKEFHNVFNPPESIFYTKRGAARPIEVLFNNKIFDAEYRFENQQDKSIELQSIRFKKELKSEFKAVFPTPEGEFFIQQGQDLNHFVFTHTANSIDIDDIENEYPEGTIALNKFFSRNQN